MRILIATPAYGGMLTTKYVHGLRESIYGAMKEPDLELGLYTMSNESLINRARNTCAAMAIEYGFDRIMFIDGDIGWKWQDLLAIIKSDKLVVGGTYPKKNLPISLNYNVLPKHLPHINNLRKSYEDHLALKQFADPATGELEVAHIPTGFMQIDIAVFKFLKNKVAAYTSRDGHGDMPKEISDYFPVRVLNGYMESEDWAFCSICRENGIPVYLNLNVVVDHTGTYTFDIPRTLTTPTTV